MTPANILLAIELMMTLAKRFAAYRDAVNEATAKGGDIDDPKLESLAEECGQTLELNRKRLEAMQKP